MKIFRPLALAISISAIALGAQAQATRTWVSGVGDDANPCSRTAPCKTFAGAISKTATGGEISVLDPGGYGAVTITKAITIDGTGTKASILSAGTTGIIVNAPTTADVAIRGVDIHGAGTGTFGVRVLQAKSFLFEDGSIAHTTSRGIEIVPAGVTSVTVTVRNTTIRNIANHAVNVTGNSKVSLDKVALINNLNDGIDTNGANVRVSLFECLVTHNGNEGVHAEGSSQVNVHNSIISMNNNGVRASTSGIIRIFGSQIDSNTTNSFFVDGGTIESHENNAIRGSGSTGVLTNVGDL